MIFMAFWFMFIGGRFSFSSIGLICLSCAFYFLAVGIYKAYFIKRAYREKFLPLLRENSRGNHESNPNSVKGGENYANSTAIE